jgi:hypothetical protein
VCKSALLVFMGAGAQVHELAAQTASKAFAAAVRPVGGDVSWRWSKELPVLNAVQKKGGSCNVRNIRTVADVSIR